MALRRVGQVVRQCLLVGHPGGKRIELDDVAVVGVEDTVPIGGGQIRAHGVICRRLSLPRALHQLWQQVVALVPQPREPVVVIGADPPALQLLCRHPKQLCGRTDAALHPVADADGGDGRVLVQRPHDRCHRIRVVEENRVGAAFLHALADTQVGGDRPQAHHHACRASRVPDDLVNAVLGRDVHVGVVIPGSVHVTRHFRAAAADGRHGEARAVERVVEVR